jgi:hypothetical protein
VLFFMQLVWWASGLVAAALLLPGCGREQALMSLSSTATEVFSGDVYVQRRGSLRHPGAQTSADEQLFNASGDPVGLTWGRLRSAFAKPFTHCVGRHHTDVRLELDGLVPGGRYSLYYATFGPDSHDPQCLEEDRALALPCAPGRCPSDIDTTSVVADEKGQALFEGQVTGCLLDASRLVYLVAYEMLPKSHPAKMAAGCRRGFGTRAVRQMVVLAR